MADLNVPDYLQLDGDEYAGVELNCARCALDAPGQASTYFPIAYYGGQGENGAMGLPYFAYNDLSGLIRFALQHGDAHKEDS